MSLKAQVTKAIEANPSVPHNALARKIAADLGEPALVALAIERIERMVMAQRRRRIRDLEEEQTDSTDDRDAAKWATVAALLEEFKHTVIVDWTNELLNSEFALGDGTTITWGAATREHHVARIALLSRNVRGNLAAIQRHEVALADIEAAGVRCLDEVPR